MRTLTISREAPDAGIIGEAAACLRAGGLVAFPTETVYGLGAHALDTRAVESIFRAKGRPFNDPLILHVARSEQVQSLVTRFPAAALALSERFWPGPLTLVLPRSPVVPDRVSAGLPSVAIRVPSHPVARALLLAAGVPVAAPSANLFSRPSPTRASHVADDLEGRIDLLLDGGPTDVGLESTVLDLSTEPPVLLRPGAVPLEALRAVVGDVRIPMTHRADDAAMPSPGLLSKHYAPRTPMNVYEGARDAVLDRLESDARRARGQGLRVATVDFGDRTLDAVAAELYATLRRLDKSSFDLILAVNVPGDGGLGDAIRDRLRRAAVHIVQV